MNCLHEGLLRLGFDGGDFSGIKIRPLSELEEKLNAYIEALQEYNAKFDLINAEGYDEIAVRHILDSLAGTEKIAAIAGGFKAEGKTDIVIADIGSGAGLPGIPLAAALCEFQFILVERMSKRCAFLEHCVSIMGLSNVTVEENQAERLEQNRFDICVFRAFRPLEKKMTHVLRRILKPHGKLAAYKAKREKIETEMRSLGKNMPVYSVEKLDVPFLTENSAQEERERNLVIINK